MSDESDLPLVSEEIQFIKFEWIIFATHTFSFSHTNTNNNNAVN